MPNPYAILGALVGAILLVVGAFFYGEHVDGLAWKAATAKLEIQAAAKLTEANKAAADKDAKNAELTRNLDTEHEAHVSELDATRADFARQLNDGLRDAERRASRGCQLPRATVGAGKPQDSPGGGNPGLSQDDAGRAERFRVIADNAMKLAAIVKDVCVPFANGVGR